MSYRLKDIRIDNDLTQKQLAHQLNVSRSTYSGWENEGDNIPLYQFNNFCELFNLSLDYVAKLIDRRENITNKSKKTLDFQLIGNRIDTIRKENNLKQKEMAEIIGVSQPTYFNYKNGNTPIQTEILKTIAKHFNISLDWLVGKSNKKYINKQ